MLLRIKRDNKLFCNLDDLTFLGYVAAAAKGLQQLSAVHLAPYCAVPAGFNFSKLCQPTPSAKLFKSILKYNLYCLCCLWMYLCANNCWSTFSKGILQRLGSLSLLGEYLHLYDQSLSKSSFFLPPLPFFSPRPPSLLFSDFPVTTICTPIG